jgi:hypothetical protein
MMGLMEEYLKKRYAKKCINGTPQGLCNKFLLTDGLPLGEPEQLYNFTIVTADGRACNFDPDDGWYWKCPYYKPREENPNG